MKRIKFYRAFTSKLYRMNLLLFPLLVILGNVAVCLLHDRFLGGGEWVIYFQMNMLMVVYLLHELMTDNSLISGLAGKRLREFTAFLSSPRGIEVFRTGLVMDLLRKAVTLALSLGLIACVNRVFYGRSLMGLPYALQCFCFIYGVMTLMLMLSRFFQSMAVNLLLFYLAMIGVNVLGTWIGGNDHASWVRAGQSVYLILGLVVSVISCIGTVTICVRKGRNAYYDE